MTQKNKLNFVAEAQIWKDHLETEREAVRKWPNRWGFLLTPVEELIKDEKKEPAKPKILLPEHLQIRPVTPVEKYIKEEQKNPDGSNWSEAVKTGMVHWANLFKNRVNAAEELEKRFLFPQEASTGSEVILRDIPGPRGLGRKLDDNSLGVDKILLGKSLCPSSS